MRMFYEFELNSTSIALILARIMLENFAQQLVSCACKDVNQVNYCEINWHRRSFRINCVHKTHTHLIYETQTHHKSVGRVSHTHTRASINNVKQKLVWLRRTLLRSPLDTWFRSAVLGDVPSQFFSHSSSEKTYEHNIEINQYTIGFCANNTKKIIVRQPTEPKQCIRFSILKCRTSLSAAWTEIRT